MILIFFSVFAENFSFTTSLEGLLDRFMFWFCPIFCETLPYVQSSQHLFLCLSSC